MDDRIPPFLTVEEAGRLLKIGRTKAYLLTKEWRASGGRSGLPVVDLGDILRVPGPAIEQMLGTGLGAPRPPTGNQVKPTAPVPAAPSAPPTPREEARAQPVAESTAGGPAAALCVPSGRARRQRRRPSDQLPLFQPLTATDPNSQIPSADHPELTTHP